MSRVNSTHSQEQRGLDAYFTPPEAVRTLAAYEMAHLPKIVHEPACGDGAIARALSELGYCVTCSDICDYGWPRTGLVDFLKDDVRRLAIVTNPPFRLAHEFMRLGLARAPYLALLMRLNVLASQARREFLTRNPPSRIIVFSRRLPMMHRLGWTGPEASSNHDHAWFIWRGARWTELVFADWREFTADPQSCAPAARE